MPAPAGALAYDDFNRADTTTGLGTATDGKVWQNSARHRILGNRLKGVDGTGSEPTAWVNAGVANYTVTATNWSGVADGGLVGRYTDDNNLWIGYSGVAGNVYTIHKREGSVYTQVAASTITPAAGDRVDLVFNGNSITLKVNGVEACSTTSTFNNAATKVGFRSGSTSGGAGQVWDEFSATAIAPPVIHTTSPSSSKAQFFSTIRLETRRRRFDRSVAGLGYFGGRIDRRLVFRHDRSLLGTGFFRGSVAASKKAPFGAFRDFSHYGDTMHDPAMVLISAEVSGVTTLDNSEPSKMRRLWMTVTPPSEYKTTTEARAWPRAAFASVGARVNQMLASGYQYIDGAQVEATPLVTSAPTAYAPARSVNITVRPDRLNYAPNPSFETNVTTGWTVGGPVSVTRDNTAASHGTYSAKLTRTGAGAVSYGMASVPASAGQAWTFSVHHKSSGVFAGGAYLQFLNSAGAYLREDWMALPSSPSAFTRTSFTATAPAGTASVAWTFYTSNGVTNDAWWLDGVLLEKTDRLLPYFDGGYGLDYLWETGGTAGAARSYYYRDRQARSYLLDRILEENCPLGVIPSVPQFAVLPSE